MELVYMKVQALLLLTTSMTISCSSCGRVSEVFVVSGSVAVLPCVMSSPSKLSTAVTWKRIFEGEERTVWRRDRSGLEFRPVGQAPAAHCPYSNFRNSEYSLHIEGTRVEDAGMYRCEVEGQTFKEVMLRVVKVSFTPAEVFEGDRLTLSCSVTPGPTPTSIKWELNGLPITSARLMQTYTIDKVSQMDAGNLSCSVVNKQPEVKASISLQVKGILVPKDNSEVVYAELGSSVTLPCIFSKELILNSFSWERVPSKSNLQAVLPSFFNISSNPGVSQFSSVQVDRSAYIESVQDGDEGTYRCLGQVKGDNGKLVNVERSIQLVTAQVLSSNRNDKMTLTCHISNARQVTSYEWIHVQYGVNNTQIFTSVQKSTSKVLKVPKEKQLGEWVCLYYKQQQLLGNVTFHLQIMSGLEGQQTSISGNKVAMVIGLFFLFLLFLLILLQVYKNHRRRKMILQYPAMETIVHLAANEREFRERVKVSEKAQNGACAKDLKPVIV